jgi:hypothetical protein
MSFIQDFKNKRLKGKNACVLIDLPFEKKARYLARELLALGSYIPRIGQYIAIRENGDPIIASNTYEVDNKYLEKVYTLSEIVELSNNLFFTKGQNVFVSNNDEDWEEAKFLTKLELKDGTTYFIVYNEFYMTSIWLFIKGDKNE